MRYPFIAQHDERDCGAACLSMVCDFYGLKLPLIKYIEAIKVDANGANMLGIVQGAEMFGMSAEALEGNCDELFQAIENNEIKLPMIARIITDSGFEHYVVVYKINKNRVLVGDPSDKVRSWNINAFLHRWTGYVVSFRITDKFEKKNERTKSFLKFSKLISNKKKLISSIFLISILTTIISLFAAFLFGYVVYYSVYGDGTKISAEVTVEEHTHEHNHEHTDGEETNYINEVLNLFFSEESISSLSSQADEIFSSGNRVFISIIFIYIIQMLLLFIRCLLVSLLCKKIDIPLMMNYYNHLIDLPIKSISTRTTGELLSRFSDASSIREVISTATITLLMDTMTVLLSGFVLYKINKILFFISLIVLLAYTLVILIYKRPTERINKKIMEQNAKVTDYLKESVIGIETIKSYGYEANVKEKTLSLFSNFVNRAFNGMLIQGSQEIIVGTVAHIGILLLLWTGSQFITSGVLSIGTMFTFYYVFTYFIEPVKNLVELQPKIQSAFVAADRLNDILDAGKEDISLKEVNNLTGDIEISDIIFRYGNRDTVLNGVSLHIKAKSNVAIVGESGCGKTTLTKLLMAFYSPEQGKITVGDKNIFEFSPESIRKRIAYVSQEIFMFSDTVYNNLKVGNPNVSNEDIETMCEKLGVDKFIKDLPLGYNTILEENGNNLSGGQKQRLAIVRALLKHPDILIMDEATSNLDTVTEQSIKSMIDNFSKDITCIIIAHRLSTIKNCDCIYVMENGKIMEQGTHQELIEKDSLYKQFVDKNK